MYCQITYTDLKKIARLSMKSYSMKLRYVYGMSEVQLDYLAHFH
jgi:hypothetical protein